MSFKKFRTTGTAEKNGNDPHGPFVCRLIRSSFVSTFPPFWIFHSLCLRLVNGSSIWNNIYEQHCYLDLYGDEADGRYGSAFAPAHSAGSLAAQNFFDGPNLPPKGNPADCTGTAPEAIPTDRGPASLFGLLLSRAPRIHSKQIQMLGLFERKASAQKNKRKIFKRIRFASFETTRLRHDDGQFIPDFRMRNIPVIFFSTATSAIMPTITSRLARQRR
jgi:hypothetical protein